MGTDFTYKLCDGGSCMSLLPHIGEYWTQTVVLGAHIGLFKQAQAVLASVRK